MGEIEQLRHRVKFLENNFKTYLYYNVYNGINLNVTGDNGWATTDAWFRPFETIETSKGSDSSYWINFSIEGQYNAASPITLTITGVTFYAGLSHALAIFPYNWDCNSAGAAQGGASTIIFFTNPTTAGCRLSGTCRLASWPTWADALI